MNVLYCIAWLAGQIFLVLGLIKRSGLENIPKKGGVILASNHAAYWDPPILGFSLFRESFFVAKQELYRHRLLGWLMSQLNTIAIKRGTADPAAYKKVINLLLSGKSLILFPEGTRSRGDQFLEPKPGIGLLALEAGVPIVPSYLKNTRNLWTTLKSRQGIAVRFGRPIEISWLAQIPRNKLGYEKVAREVMSRIEKLRNENK